MNFCNTWNHGIVLNSEQCVHPQCHSAFDTSVSAAEFAARDKIHITCVCLGFMSCSVPSLKCITLHYKTKKNLCIAKPDCTAHILIVNIARHFFLRKIHFFKNPVTSNERHRNFSLLCLCLKCPFSPMPHFKPYTLHLNTSIFALDDFCYGILF